jgi:glycosyltransferase involved in cell wall biosynthesis
VPPHRAPKVARPDEGGANRVAVVIPSRNRWPLLRTAIAGALAQRDVEVEVVVVDDGSTDQTVDELARVDDERVSVVRLDRSHGVSAARNIGLERVRAPWVAFLDDDDVWAPGHLAAMLAAVASSQQPIERVGLVYSQNLIVDAERRVLEISPAAPPETVREGMKKRNVVGGPSRVMLRTDVVRSLGGFDETLSIVADWDLWLRVVADREAVRCPTLLVGYMRHYGNMHLDVKRLFGELSRLQEKHRWDPPKRRRGLVTETLPAYIAWTYRAGGQRFRAARWYIRSYRTQGTRRDLARAVAALLGERVTELSGLRERMPIDPSLTRWLEEVHAAECATSSGLPALFEPPCDRRASA